MNINITFRGMEHGETLEKHIHQQMGKIENFLKKVRDPKTVNIVLGKHPNHAHNEVHIHIIGPQYEVVVKKEGELLIPLINEAIDIAYHDLLKIKEKIVDEHKRGLKGHL